MNLRRVLLSAALIVGALRADGVTAAQAATPDARQNPPGDESRGKALVESSGCFDCHRIDRRGSRVGPISLTSVHAGRPNVCSRRCSTPTMKCSSRTATCDSSRRTARQSLAGCSTRTR